MPTMKKKEVKFCPVCGAQALPVRETAFSVCTSCGLSFRVDVEFKPIRAKVGGTAHKSECGNFGGNRGKVCHSSVVEAFARCLELEDVPNREREKQVFYICRWCEKVHFGHIGKSGVKKNATVAYDYFQAKVMYEQALENKEIEISLK